MKLSREARSWQARKPYIARSITNLSLDDLDEFWSAVQIRIDDMVQLRDKDPQNQMEVAPRIIRLKKLLARIEHARVVGAEPEAQD